MHDPGPPKPKVKPKAKSNATAKGTAKSNATAKAKPKAKADDEVIAEGGERRVAVRRTVRRRGGAKTGHAAIGPDSPGWHD